MSCISQGPLGSDLVCILMITNTYYQPSGRISWKTPFRPLLTGLPWVILLAGIYACVIRYNPFVYVSFIATIALGVATGVVAVLNAQSALSRSRAFDTILAAVFGFAAVWTQWVVWLWLNVGDGMQEVWRVALSPTHWIDYLSWFSQHWHVSLSRRGHGAELSPGNLQALWWVEAVAIIGLSALAARFGGDASVFNERSRRWAEKCLQAELAADDSGAPAWRDRIERDGAAALLGLRRADVQGAPSVERWQTLDVSCLADEGDADFCLIAVDLLTHTRKSDGKLSTHREAVIRPRFVSAADFARVREHLANHAPAADAQASAEHDPPELSAAIDHLQAGRLDEAIALAEPYTQASEAKLRADAFRVCALACSGQKRWSEAHAHFAALFEVESSAHNALQLATTAVMAGNVAIGQEWFDKAWTLNLTSGEIPPPTMQTSYATALESAGRPELALPCADWLRAAYESLSITDSTFLHLRHMPFFNAFLEKSLPIVKASLPAHEIPAWYRSMRAHLDEAGQSAIDTHIERLAA